MGGALLEVSEVTLRFGGVTALAGVGFDVRPDELFAVIGPNGAGKTSIFNCLSAVYRPQSGSIVLDGTAAALKADKDIREFYLGIGARDGDRERRSFRDVKTYRRKKSWGA